MEDCRGHGRVGEEIDRKRYEAFACSAVARSDPPAPISHDVGAMKQALSGPFEIAERGCQGSQECAPRGKRILRVLEAGAGTTAA